MSHIVEIKTEIRDQFAAASACQRLSLPAPKQGKHQLYSRSEIGLAIDLPGWKYPIVCNTKSGEVRYDNYKGHWGSQEELDQFLQMYAVEKTKLEARKKGHRATEQVLPNGSIKLTVHVGDTV